MTSSRSSRSTTSAAAGPDLTGRQVVVTGGSGALGLAVTRRLLAAGARCHLPVRRLFAWEGDGAERVSIAGGVELADEAAVARVYDGLPALWASIHCAGSYHGAPLVETSLDDLRGQLESNLVGPFLCCREAARRMAAGGRLVNVVARPALEPRAGAGAAAYTASKAALAGLTLALAEELARSAILVNAVAPSTMDTPANRAAFPGVDPSSWPSVDEVAEAIVALVDPRNVVVQGALIPVYGGGRRRGARGLV